MLSIFEHAVQKVSGILHLEPAIMESLFWASVPTLNTVHPMEENVVRLRKALTTCLTNAVQPVVDYLAKYQK